MTNGIDREEFGVACLVCGRQESQPLYAGLRRCAECGFVWADLSLSPEEWRALYDDHYFFGQEYVDYVLEEPALRKNFQRNLRWVMSRAASGRLLEIGSAYGFFLDEARRHFKVEGVEINQKACAYTREHFEVPVHCGDFLAMDFPPNSFDVVVMWDAMEHIPGPHLFVRKIASILKPGGYFFCSTPDMASFLARSQGRHWRQIHPPTHISYFSAVNLGRMLGTAGLVVEEERWFGEYRTWQNIFYSILVLRHGWQKLYDMFNGRGWMKKMFYLNTFDHMFFAAKKPV